MRRKIPLKINRRQRIFTKRKNYWKSTTLKAFRFNVQNKCLGFLEIVFGMVYVELHPHRIAPIFKKKCIKSFCMHKTWLFSYNFPFFIWFIPLVDIIEIKPSNGDHESNFKKVGKIPCGCNTKWTFWYGIGQGKSFSHGKKCTSPFLGNSFLFFCSIVH